MGLWRRALANRCAVCLANQVFVEKSSLRMTISLKKITFKKLNYKSKRLLKLIKRFLPGKLKFDRYDSQHFPFRVKVSGYGIIEVAAKTKIYLHCIIDADEPSASISIGKRCVVRSHTILMTYGGKIIIGDDCTINPFCVLYGHGGLKIGNGVLVGAHTVFIPANHSYSDIDNPIYLQEETREWHYNWR